MKIQPTQIGIILSFWLCPAPAAVLYVDVNSTNATPPYSDWSTAATDIQSAVDAASDGDQIFVNDGTYQTGGRVYNNSLTNRVVVNKAVTVQSVNGPGATFIQGNPEIGSNAVRCVFLGSNAVLSGFTIAGGATKDFYAGETDGGGVWAEDVSATITNCALSGNQAFYQGGGAVGGTVIDCMLSGNSGYAGGGASGCNLVRCTISGNTAVYQGGGASECTASNCTISGNDAYEGGGAFHGTENNCNVTGNTANLGGGAAWSKLNNCLVSGNSATYGGGAQSGALNNCTVVLNSGGGAAGSGMNNCILFYNDGGNYYDHWDNASLNYCCTTPMPGSGAGNIATEPSFVDLPDGNFHLRIFSPCIDAGDNSTVAGGSDLDGNARVVNGTVDIGAYEFHGAVHYVDIDNLNPLAPYADWTTAATNIQDAIDVAGDGDLILVTNGLYAGGGRTVNGYALTNRVAVTKPVSVQSVNGPEVTIIEGYQVPGTTNGAAAIRCVYLTNGAALSGFTVTNGATSPPGYPGNWGDWFNEQSGGGIWSGSTNTIITNCVIAGNSAGDSGGGGILGTYINCAFVNNFAYDVGGGVYNSTIQNCTLDGNFGNWGGGGAYYPWWGYSGRVDGCLFKNNISSYNGGGVWGGKVTGCILTGNIVNDQYFNDGEAYGGGADSSALVNCVLAGNVANTGGGADGCDLYNCVLTNNYANYTGGGLAWSYGVNCTVVSNSAAQDGGGVDGCYMENSIIYFNDAPTNANDFFEYSQANDCCTTPAVPGAGNFTADPQFVNLATGDLHLQNSSPCVSAGNNDYLTNGGDSVVLTSDLDGGPRVTGVFVDVGAYEVFIPAAIVADYTNVAPGFSANFLWQFVAGNISDTLLDFADGTVLTNPVMPMAHSWTNPGTYPVTITAFSDLYPGGISATCVVQVAVANYVSASSTNPTAPYTSWDTAATSIQDAVNSGFAGGTVWVRAGVYQSGAQSADGFTSNRLVITKPMVLQSIDGPAATVIDGGGTLRCAYLSNNVVIDGFTLQNGYTGGKGGGALCDSSGVLVSNCVLASNVAETGGGAFGGEIFNSAFISNSVSGSGGGAESGTLNHCTLTGNFAGASGGGVDNSVLTNCIVYYNTAPVGPDFSSGSLNFCDTRPLPPDGNNITAAPQLTDAYHISSTSPCFAAGSMAGTDGADIDGESWRNPPSIGCDEFYAAAAGTLNPTISADYTNVATGFTVKLAGIIYGHASVSVWNFGDGSTATNEFWTWHTWTNSGDFNVTLTAFNDDNPSGVTAALVIHVASQPVYVSAASVNPVAPYSSWDTAATNIQDAVDAATVPGTLVLVTNGVYQYGGWATTDGTTNRVTAARPMNLHSVNGAAFTIIDGGGAVRCVSLGNRVTLDGFTLTNGFAGDRGGGVFGLATNPVSNCTVIGNTAGNGGGGACGVALANCELTNNSTYNWNSGGAGAVGCTLNNCLVTGNATAWQSYGGGLSNCVAVNSWIVGNSAEYAAGAEASTFSNCVIANNNGYFAGGVEDSTLGHCVLTNNVAGNAGGALNSSLDSCLVAYNVATVHYGIGNWGGGGAFNCVLNNCTVTHNDGYLGGGMNGGYATNCIFYTNTAAVTGGGAFLASLENCTLVGNSAGYGGGADGCALQDCIVYYNNDGYPPGGAANTWDCALSYCCSTPDLNGDGNVTNEPLFIDLVSGDFHLQSNSPCINAGKNAYVFATNDFDGNPRIAGGTVDIGAYEYQTPGSILSYAWLEQYGLPTDGSVDFADMDGTGMNNWQKSIAGLNPFDTNSVFVMLPPAGTNSPGVTVSWKSVDTRNYYLQRADNLAAQPAFTTIQSNLVGQAGVTSYTDTSATNGGPYFYRVGVQ